MGFTKTTENVQIYKLTQTGSGGYWFVKANSQAEVAAIGYSSGEVVARSQLYGADTFIDLLTKLNNNSVTAQDVGNQIRVDELLQKHDIESEVLGLSNAQLTGIDNAFNINVLIVRWANPLLGVMYLRKGDRTWSQLQEGFTTLGERSRLDWTRLNEILDLMVANSDITQAQKDAYLIDWNNNPNI
jgi:hypothetical protein